MTEQRQSEQLDVVRLVRDEPDGSVELIIHLDVDPASLTSPAVARAAFDHHLAPELARLAFVTTDPVTVTVTCVALPSVHPGTVGYPNMERWMAPLVDALAGPDRMLARASQVRSIAVRSAAASADPGRLSLSVAFVPEPARRPGQPKAPGPRRRS